MRWIASVWGAAKCLAIALDAALVFALGAGTNALDDAMWVGAILI